MSAEKLERTVQLARQHDVTLYAWLVKSIARWQDGECSLAVALNLEGTGAKAERNRQLAAAAESLAPGGTAHAKAKALVRAAERGTSHPAASRAMEAARLHGPIPSERQLRRLFG